MAFLLLLHEKMRLQRNYNKMVLRSSQLANRKSRIANNITKVQKMYSNKMTQLEQSTKMLQNQFTMGIQNMFGLGTQNQMFNPMNMGGYGITSFVANQMASMLANGGKAIELPDGKGGTLSTIFDQNKYQAMMTEYMSGTLKEQIGDDNKGTGKYGANGTFEKVDVDAFNQAMAMAQRQQSQAQMMCQQMSSNYQTNVSVWLEAQKTQLEAEQDAALAPLEAEQTDIDLEQAGLETQMADAKARLESLKQACSEGIKESAPTFGLG